MPQFPLGIALLACRHGYKLLYITWHRMWFFCVVVKLNLAVN